MAVNRAAKRILPILDCGCGLLLAVVLSGLCAAVPLPASANGSQHAHSAPSAVEFSTDDEANTIEVFDRSADAVVFITRQQRFRQMFSNRVFERSAGSGSGIIWDRKGHIVTNHHVVRGASRLLVVMPDGSEVEGRVVGSAPDYDLAVLRVELPANGDIVTLPLGDSDDLRVGSKVLAIGNPFGFDRSLSVGVVSALDRELALSGAAMIRNAIQTDAAINPGNSGGPLLNSRGQLIGINMLIYTLSGSSAGVGMAIPVNTVRRVVPKLIEHGRLRQVLMGIEYLSNARARSIGAAKGVPILRALSGLPAALAGMVGLRQDERGNVVLGDVIININGSPIDGVEDLLRVLEDADVDQQLRITTIRDGKEQKFEVTPIER